MNRMFGAVLVGLLAAAAAQGHFTFVVPEPGGASVKVIFSDDLKPDTAVNVEKIADTKLTVRDASGKETPVTLTKGDGCYTATVPGTGDRVVSGVTEYGVLQKGDAKPFRLVYHPRALIGSPQVSAAATEKLVILPEKTGGKVRFRVVTEGKPLADAEVSVIAPDGKKHAAKTDKDGLTQTFDAPGRYGVVARLSEMKSGEYAGRKYEEVRHYATLVADAGGK
jgi:uncharacterized GH25 family protein